MRSRRGASFHDNVEMGVALALGAALGTVAIRLLEAALTGGAKETGITIPQIILPPTPPPGTTGTP